MGIPQEQRPSNSAAMNTHRPSHVEGSPQLPPEALELATKIFDFARQGKTPELRQYIDAGIPVNLTNHKGDTLLMLASYYGNLETVKMLLENEADMNVLNDRGQSPIAGAVFKGYEEIVKAMVEKGADVHAGQPNAIDSARMFRREGCLRMFGMENES